MASVLQAIILRSSTSSRTAIYALAGLTLPFITKKLYASAILCLSIATVEIIRALLLARETGQQEEDAARSYGARKIPKIKGWLPGNVDVLWQISVGDHQGYPTEVFAKWAEVYGPTFDMGILWAHQIVTVDPEVVKQVTLLQFPQFEKGKKFNNMLFSFLGNGIFTTDGPTWKAHRSIARPFFAQDRISDFDCFSKYTNKLLFLLESLSEESKSVDIQDVFRSFSLDVTMEFLFGKQSQAMDTYRDPSAATQQMEFKKAFDEMTQLMSTRIRLGASQYKYFEPLGDKSLKLKKAIDGFVEPIVMDAFSEGRPACDAQESATFLDHLMKSTPSRTEQRFPDEVKDELLNFLLAGRDTTAAALTFSIYMLILTPSVSQKVRTEILSTVGEGADVGPTDLKRMRYLRAFIDEVLRLFPPVPFNIRRSNKVTTLHSSLYPEGVPLYMPAGVSVTWSTMIFHRRKDIWGEDAEDFKPERWLEGTHAVNARRDGNFLPFNSGPRVCLGQNFAYTLISYVLVRILQRFSLELAPECQPKASLPPTTWKTDYSTPFSRKRVERICPKAAITMFAKGGLWIKPIQSRLEGSG